MVATFHSKGPITVNFPELGLTVFTHAGPRGLNYPAPGFHFRTNTAKAHGFGDLAFYKVAELSPRNSVYAATREIGLADGDLVAEIVNFYPHGKDKAGSNTAQYRKGIGSALYDLMLQETERAGAKAFIAQVTSIEMIKFLRKRDFLKAEREFNSTHVWMSKILSNLQGA